MAHFTSGAQIAAQLLELAAALESAGRLDPGVQVWVSVDLQVSVGGPDCGRRRAVDQLAASVGRTTVTAPSDDLLTEVYRTRFGERSPVTAVDLFVYAPKLATMVDAAAEVA